MGNKFAVIWVSPHGDHEYRQEFLSLSAARKQLAIVRATDAAACLVDMDGSEMHETLAGAERSLERALKTVRKVEPACSCSLGAQRHGHTDQCELDHKPRSRTAAIRSLMEDSGMSRSEAVAHVDAFGTGAR